MDKSLIIYTLIGVAFFIVVTRFVGDLQKNDNLDPASYDVNAKYNKFMTRDSVGQNILDVADELPQMQIAAWQHTTLKEEYIELFPDFDTMRIFIDERVRGDYLVSRLKKQLNNIEDKFYSGAIGADEAKRMLKKLQ